MPSSCTRNKIRRVSLNSLHRLGKEYCNSKNEWCQPGRMSVDTAFFLSNNIAVRLVRQLDYIQRLSEIVDNLIQPPKNPIENHVFRHGEVLQKRIVYTSKYLEPLWWKKVDKAEDSMDRKVNLKNARKKLNNLQFLHTSTLEMVENICTRLDGKLRQRQNNIPELDKTDEYMMTSTIEQVRDRHGMSLENMSEFVFKTRPYINAKSHSSDADFDPIIMQFLGGRFGIQLLCEHTVTPNGFVSVDCSLEDVIEDAIFEAKHLCESHYSHFATASPEVYVTRKPGETSHHHVTIIRPWLQYVLVELLKNALSISMEKYAQRDVALSQADDIEPPPIFIFINNESESNFVTIEIMDQGGGFSSSKETPTDGKLFGFMVKKQEKLWDRLDDQHTYAQVRCPMTGLGVGLCLSRLTMQHFGGTVELKERNCSRQALASKHETLTDLELGCTASIKINKDFDLPEQLYLDDCEGPEFLSDTMHEDE